MHCVHVHAAQMLLLKFGIRHELILPAEAMNTVRLRLLQEFRLDIILHHVGALGEIRRLQASTCEFCPLSTWVH